MFEPVMLTVAQLADRWGQSTNQILEHAMGLRIQMYFAYEGLVFDVNDDWLRHGGDWLVNRELESLEKTIEGGERELQRNVQKYHETGIPGRSDDDVKAIRARIDSSIAERKKLLARLDDRQLRRNRSEYRGYLRLGPATLDEIYRLGAARHPDMAYWIEGEVKVRKLRDGEVVLDGPIVRLEQVRPATWKERLTADDALVSMAEVKAIEGLRKSKRDPDNNETVSPVTPTVLPSTKPIPKQKLQQVAILEWLQANGYNSQSLPMWKTNSPGAKAEVKAAMLANTSLFSDKSFEQAWERLSGAKDIQYKK
jgi:SLT domain-containing protein